jgi:hypothetical protein
VPIGSRRCQHSQQAVSAAGLSHLLGPLIIGPLCVTQAYNGNESACEHRSQQMRCVTPVIFNTTASEKAIACRAGGQLLACSVADSAIHNTPHLSPNQTHGREIESLRRSAGGYARTDPLKRLHRTLKRVAHKAGTVAEPRQTQTVRDIGSAIPAQLHA